MKKKVLLMFRGTNIIGGNVNGVIQWPGNHNSLVSIDDRNEDIKRAN